MDLCSVKIPVKVKVYARGSTQIIRKHQVGSHLFLHQAKKTKDFSCSGVQLSALRIGIPLDTSDKQKA